MEMDELDTLRDMYPERIDVIRNYLLHEMPGAGIRIGEDFERDGVTFRSELGMMAEFRLFVSREFLSDVQPEEMQTTLQRWNVAKEVAALPSGSTLFVLTNGTFTEPTRGQTLRESTGRFSSVIPPSEALKDLYERVFSIRVNGEVLGDTSMEMQGDPTLYLNYSEDFANALGAAYLLDGAGYRNFTLNTWRQSPRDIGIDFEVRLPSGETGFLEFKRAITPTERRASALRERVNIALRIAMRNDQRLAAAIAGHFIQITLPLAPSTRTDVDHLATEIIRFVVSEEWVERTGTALV